MNVATSVDIPFHMHPVSIKYNGRCNKTSGEKNSSSVRVAFLYGFYDLINNTSGRQKSDNIGSNTLHLPYSYKYIDINSSHV
jgi:hypothetical protein